MSKITTDRFCLFLVLLIAFGGVIFSTINFVQLSDLNYLKAKFPKVPDKPGGFSNNDLQSSVKATESAMATLTPFLPADSTEVPMDSSSDQGGAISVVTSRPSQSSFIVGSSTKSSKAGITSSISSFVPTRKATHSDEKNEKREGSRRTTFLTNSTVSAKSKTSSSHSFSNTGSRDETGFSISSPTETSNAATRSSHTKVCSEAKQTVELPGGFEWKGPEGIYPNDSNSTKTANLASRGFEVPFAFKRLGHFFFYIDLRVYGHSPTTSQDPSTATLVAEPTHFA